jgi:DNA-binding IclR family transcriptional regulator
MLRVEESSHPVIMTMKVGATLPLMHSAAGRVFAAFMPRRIIAGAPTTQAPMQ